MESIQHIHTAGVQLEEPHFDDELTVITAQPVVPLEIIAEEQTSRKRWLLAGAFALSLLLGAGSALLAVRIKRQLAEPSDVQSMLIVEEEPVRPDVSQIQGGETPVIAAKIETEPLEEEADEEDAIPAPATTNKTERNRASKVASRVVTKSQPVKRPVVAQEEERQPVLVDQWEESRSRRVWRRERRERRQHQDLFRVGEIFEGRRPNQ